MEPLERDEIVPVSANMARYYGAQARMLLPGRATVEAAVKKVPKGRLITIDLLRERLAADAGVETTCPFNTKLCLRAIANRSGVKTAYWRVVRKNGELLAYYPGGLTGHGKLLKAEGFAIDSRGRAPKVKDLAAKLAPAR